MTISLPVDFSEIHITKTDLGQNKNINQNKSSTIFNVPFGLIYVNSKLSQEKVESMMINVEKYKKRFEYAKMLLV